MIIAVIGAGSCDKEIYGIAEEVGRLIARKGDILVTGGLGGVMEAASKGAKEAGGITVGILPGFSKEEANNYLTVPIITGLSHARNIIIARSADALIAVSGGYGTLSEIAVALKLGKPVAGIKTWDNIEGVIKVNSPEEAIRKISESK
ncbi:MAG TPA: TIGR00725 family protein [Nitrospirae bacterium]|nr:LOG family protein ORF6 in fasciation locus [bacterium BMS3Abin06]HDH10680.1 TIGR00725 family protein [Nitrospirota bacterium]